MFYINIVKNKLFHTSVGIGVSSLAALLSVLPFPIVFDSMALTWPEVSALKQAIWENCPDINSWQYRSSPQSHTTCER